MFVDIAWKMFQQEGPTKVEKFLAVSSAAQLHGLLAAFDHLPAQIRWAIDDDATGTQSWHLGRPNGQRTRTIAALIFATVRLWWHRQSCVRMATRRHGNANNQNTFEKRVTHTQNSNSKLQQFQTDTHTKTHQILYVPPSTVLCCVWEK